MRYFCNFEILVFLWDTFVFVRYFNICEILEIFAMIFNIWATFVSCRYLDTNVSLTYGSIEYLSTLKILFYTWNTRESLRYSVIFKILLFLLNTLIDWDIFLSYRYNYVHFKSLIRCVPYTRYVRPCCSTWPAYQIRVAWGISIRGVFNELHSGQIFATWCRMIHLRNLENLNPTQHAY